MFGEPKTMVAFQDCCTYAAMLNAKSDDAWSRYVGVGWRLGCLPVYLAHRHMLIEVLGAVSLDSRCTHLNIQIEAMAARRLGYLAWWVGGV